MGSSSINTTMKSDFSKLAEVIHQASKGRQIYYLPNPGNLGDAIIRVGTQRFLHDFGIDCLPLTHIGKDQLTLQEGSRILSDLESRDAILLYGGGGGWCSIWKGGQEIVSQLAPRFHHTIVLPSTYEVRPNIAKTTFFARDRYQSVGNAPFASFCHDLGFYAPTDVTYHKPTAGTGFCFRKDIESGFERKWRIPLSNHDISWTGNYLSDPKPMFEYLASFKVIHTDRLHVAISCCRLGVKAFLYPGAYFKNQAVFLTSIAPYFDNVRWRNHLPINIVLLNKLQRKLNSMGLLNS